ncbi:MAG: hypothetical protein ABJF10_30045 [Chthoniobacter sp.]|uniref:hypothetical protein n=1 Tax=Chthoniobacter sp. TaxID=2510640 RepID=UPI0032AAD57D
MKTTPRLVILAGLAGAFFVVAPSAFSMNTMERTVTTQTQSVRREATEYQRRVAESHARAYMAKHLRAVRQDSRTHEADR